MDPRLTCHCTVCGRTFEYGDDASPMFDTPVWDALICHYRLEAHQRRALARQNATPPPPCSDRSAHIYICARCAEKALGRPIRTSDLNGSTFNQPFLSSYFSSDI